MAIRATYVRGGANIDFAVGPSMDALSQAIVDEVYQDCPAGTLECREHDDDPRLAHLRGPDGRVHGAWVHIRKNPAKTKWVIAHSAKSAIPVTLRSHEIPVAKSPQHQWGQDYICRASEDGGFPSRQEVVLPSNTRLDVEIDGALGRVGVEIQHSHLGIPKVRARHRKAGREGIPLLWAADSKNPDFAFKVPHFETNNPLPHGSMPRGSWNVTTGTRRVVSVHCDERNRDLLARCWKPRRRNWCGGLHAVFRPIHGLVVDDVVQQFAAGELVELNTGLKQGTIIVSRADFDLWQHEFAHQIPTAPQRQRNPASVCSYAKALQQVTEAAASPVHQRVAELAGTCSNCGETSFALADGHCMRCRWDLGMWGR